MASSSKNGSITFLPFPRAHADYNVWRQTCRAEVLGSAEDTIKALAYLQALDAVDAGGERALKDRRSAPSALSAARDVTRRRHSAPSR